MQTENSQGGVCGPKGQLDSRRKGLFQRVGGGDSQVD